MVSHHGIPNHLSPRERIIGRVLNLPVDQLPFVDMFLTSLESSAPISSPVVPEPPSQSRIVIPLPIPETPLSRDWPHAPLHRLSEQGTYFVTGSTYLKQHFYQSADRLDLLESRLLALTKERGWRLEAWAVFSNHYHFVAQTEADFQPLSDLLKQLHGEMATAVNRLDEQPGRQVWFNFRDTQLTFEKSYLARLNYVHQNAVKHGLVRVANQYRWCSAAWFERTATPAQVKTIYSFPTTKVRVIDDFDPVYL